MTDATRRGRILAASRRERPDRLPFFHYWRHSQVGWAERECRNRGMGICWVRPGYVERLHHVEVVERPAVINGHSAVQRVYTTPVGTVSCAEMREPGTGQWHGQRSWKDITPWQVERLIKGPEDYRVVQYMVENTEYVADPFPIEQATDWLGDEGVVLSGLPHSPMQTLMIDWIGSEGGRVFYHLADYPDLVEGLYRALCHGRRALHEIAAGDPAPIVLCGDNLDAFLVSPDLFERFFLPVYEEQARLLHQRGKLMAVHMDGRLASLKSLIARTPIDIVEALHPPPMGDLSLAEALAAWPDKCIWVGFPSSVYAEGPEATRAYAVSLLEQAGPGDRLAVAMSTENLVSNENLLALTGILEQASLPLTEAGLAHLRGGLHA
ncbi:MAG: hypothetical protein WDA75_15430 [Candidatus Latescibacterota bacterium]|jgi:hypothetical protein